MSSKLPSPVNVDVNIDKINKKGSIVISQIESITLQLSTSNVEVITSDLKDIPNMMNRVLALLEQMDLLNGDIINGIMFKNKKYITFLINFFGNHILENKTKETERMFKENSSDENDKTSRMVMLASVVGFLHLIRQNI